MTVQMRTIPNCCTAAMIQNFGYTATTSLTRYNPSKERLKRQITERVNMAKTGGYAIVVAYTNSDQKIAAEVLKELGFQRTRPLKSRKHRTRLQMWWMPIEDWENRET